MRNGLLGSIAALAAGAGLAFGQAPQSWPGPGILDQIIPAGAIGEPTASPYGPDGAPTSAAEGVFGGGAAPARNFQRAWAKGEYLLWGVSPGPSPFPLVVSGTTANGVVPDLPGAVTLFGGSGFNFGNISGARAEVGALLPGSNRCGIELDGFILPKRSISAIAGSGPLGIPALGIPFFNELTQTTDSFFASSLGNPGTISALATSMTWSAEANVFANVYRSECFSWNLMAGFRFLSLEEEISIQGTRTIGTAGQTFEGNPLPLGARTSWEDKFQTSNRFYGVNLGGTAEYRWRRFAFDVAFQAALGDMRRVESVNGFSQVVTGVGAAAVVQRVPGGLFTQTTNITTLKDNVFCVIPELRFDLHYQLTQCVRLGVGYSALYVSHVIRPGGLIDPVVNPTLVPFRPEFGLPLGTARPMQVFHTNDFWAQGVNWTVTLMF